MQKINLSTRSLRREWIFFFSFSLNAFLFPTFPADHPFLFFSLLRAFRKSYRNIARQFQRLVRKVSWFAIVYREIGAGCNSESLIRRSRIQKFQIRNCQHAKRCAIENVACRPFENFTRSKMQNADERQNLPVFRLFLRAKIRLSVYTRFFEALNKLESIVFIAQCKNSVNVKRRPNKRLFSRVSIFPFNSRSFVSQNFNIYSH